MATAVSLGEECDREGGISRPVAYGWLVFALCFGLLISDYMARQVLNAVFPLLKAEWQLSDSELGLLSGVVAVMVGLLTIPLSLLADRWGRVRSLTIMAILWSLATVFCAMASGFGEMLVGRALVGIGEAAYGSVGIALVLSVFPQRMRATLSAAFMAGAVLGQILGVAVGAQIAAVYGWREAFFAIGFAGLILGLAFPMLVRETRVAALAGPQGRAAQGAKLPPLRSLIANRSVRLTYLGSGLQFFAVGAMPAWLPSFFNRYYELPVDQAGRLAALMLLMCGAGMIICGMISDRIVRNRSDRAPALAATYSFLTAITMSLAFALPPGSAQLAFLAVAMFTVAGTSGSAGAMVAGLTPQAIHGSAFATLTLANNVFGLAPGPIVTGRIADKIGLDGAFQVVPVVCVAAAVCFAAMRSSYSRDLATLKTGER